MMTRLTGQPVADVLHDRHVRKQGVVLKDKPDAAPVRRYVRAVLRHDLAGQFDAAGVGALKTCNQPQCRCLAATRGAQQDENLVVAHVKRHPIDHRIPVGVEPLAQVGDIQ